MTNPELNKAVHEALGNCVHDIVLRRKHGSMLVWCKKCKRDMKYDDDPDVPDYCTDPRLWWPLAMELLKADCMIYLRGHNEREFTVREVREVSPHPDIIQKEPLKAVGLLEEAGLVICRAWLKMKGVEIDKP